MPHGIRFELAVREDAPETQSLHRAIHYLASELDAGVSASSIAARELEQLILLLLLRSGQHNFSHQLASGTGAVEPWQIRVAEEYIEANWDQPITVELLSKVTQASARSLFERFRNYRGYSPMTFVRQVRLRKAREMLSAPDMSTSVTGVALKCGFMNAGHFSRHYKSAFDELPSATLSRSRPAAKI